MFKSAPAANSLGFFYTPRPAKGVLSKDDPLAGKSIDWKQWAGSFKNAGLITAVSNDPVADVLHGFDRLAPQIKEWR